MAKEDMIEIILNLKKVNFKVHSNDPVVLELTAKGPKSVTAADFKANASVEVLNADTHIATLDKGANFNSASIDGWIGTFMHAWNPSLV